MIVTDADKATGERLQRMRMDAAMSQTEAVKRANQFAISSNRPERFSIRAIRRWEKLGTDEHDTKVHGTTPASLAELYILLRIYGGNPTFLMFGIEPVLCGVSELVRLNAQLTEGGMIDCINEVTAWSEHRQKLFMAFFEEFVKDRES